MIIEIGDTIVNTDNICKASKHDVYTVFKKNRPEDVTGFNIQVRFTNSSSTIHFDKKEQLEIAWQTLKLCETVHFKELNK